MNILYITPYVPSHIRVRPYNLIRALLDLGHQVTLLTSASTLAEEQELADELESWGARVELFPVPLARSALNSLRALPSHEPLQAVFSYHPKMEQRLTGLLREQTFDIVHIEHIRAARLVRSVRPVPVIYDAVDCISLLFEQTARTSPQAKSRWMARLDLARTRRYEAWLLTQYDHIVITSERDKRALDALGDRHAPTAPYRAPITVVSNGVDIDYFQSNAEPRHGQTVVFSGKMSYHANVAAVLYFAEQVLPLIWQEKPDVRFQIVGKDPPDKVRRLATDERIQVTGYVDDLRPYLAHATAAVCPVQYAVGVQNKVLEAMAMSTPTISTPAGCAALDLTSGQEILLGKDATAFANAVIRVLSDPVLRTRLSALGRQYVETHHSWEASARQLTRVYEQSQAQAANRA